MQAAASGTLGSWPPSEALQHLADLVSWVPHGRPVAAIHRTMSPLRCGPSNRPLAAGAKSDHRRTGSVRDKLSLRCGCANDWYRGRGSNNPLKKLGLRGHGFQEIRAILPQETKVTTVDSHLLF